MASDEQGWRPQDLYQFCYILSFTAWQLLFVSMVKTMAAAHPHGGGAVPLNWPW